MRTTIVSAAFFIAVSGIVPSARAVPLLTMEYAIDSLSRTLQFMGDGSVRVCTDSVGVIASACDGSVVPAPGALFRSVNGSVQELAPLRLLGDGSVSVAGDGSVMPSDDFVDIVSLGFNPNPLLALSVSIIDSGAPSLFAVTLAGPLSLGTNAFDFELAASASLVDAGTDGVSMQPLSFSLVGLPDGLVAAAVESGGTLSGVSSLGAGGLSGTGAFDLGPVTGSGTCVGCTTQYLEIGFTGSGGGDQYRMQARFDLSAANAVPAPATLSLVVLGLLGIRAHRRGSA